MTSLPSLDAIAADPGAAAQLPRPTLQALAVQALTVQQACALALLAREERPSSPVEDAGLTVEEAAPKLGMAPRTLYRAVRHRLVFAALRIPTGTRSVRLSAVKVAALARGEAPADRAQAALRPLRRSGRA